MVNLPRGFLLKLNSAARKMRDSEVSPSDLAEAPTPAVGNEIELVDLVKRRYKLASDARLVHEREWLEAVAFRDGNQWVEWRQGTNVLERIQDPDDPYRKFLTSNKIDTLIEKIKQHVTQTQPDVTVEPVTPRPEDVGAADEASDLMAHFDLIHDFQDVVADVADCALVAGTGFLKHYWDPDGEAVVWSASPDGQISAKLAAVGEVCRCVVPAFEVYPDPDGRAPRDWRWLIHVKRRSLDYIQEHFGERGYAVEAEAGDGYAGYIDTRLDAISGDGIRSGASNRHSAYVYEMWEKPSRRYPKGRRIVVAGNRLMSDPERLDWPYEKTDSFPFVPLGYRKRSHSAWARGAVHDQIPLQRQLNNILSRANDKINSERVTILVPDTSEISTDSYHLRGNLQKVVYSGGLPPTFQTPPPVTADVFNMLGVVENMMEDMAGTHEVSQGQIPAGVSSGTAIELLQMEDQSLNAGFVKNIETAVQESAEWCLALARQFYREPRLIATGSSANPMQNQIAAHDFRNLSAGGQVRVRVLPGSAIGKSPAARDEKILGLAQAGLFNPQNLPATLVLLKMMQLNRDDAFVRELQSVVQQQLVQQQAQQAQPMAAQQQILEQKAAEQLAQHQHEQTLQQMKNDGKIQEAQEKASGQSSMIDQENRYELFASELDKRTPPITVNLRGNLDTQGVEDAEGALGLG